MVAKRKTRAASQPLRSRRPGVLGRDLAFLWTAAHHRQEALTGAIAEVHNAAPIGSPWGLAADCSTGQRNIEWLLQPITTSNGSGTGDFTLLAVANPNTSATTGHVFTQKNDAAGSPFAQTALLANAAASGGASSGSFTFFVFNGASYGAAATGLIDGNYHVWVGVRRGTAYELYCDGALAATVGGVAVNINQANRYTAVGSRGNGTTDAFADNVLAAAAWNTALQAEEIAGLGTPDKVLQLFGVRRSLWAVSAGGGGGFKAAWARNSNSIIGACR